MQTYALSTVALYIRNIREEIRLKDFAVAGCEELDFWCADRASEEDRSTCLNQIGYWEGWTVERQPDGKVRFSALPIRADGSFVSHPVYPFSPSCHWGRPNT